VHDISLDLDKLGQDNGGEGSSGATHVLALPTLEPAAKSDTELLMDELIRLGVGGNIFATLNKFEFDGEGVKNGLVVFYELFVWGMQRCDFISPPPSPPPSHPIPPLTMGL
jgi:hypothetical protein